MSVLISRLISDPTNSDTSAYHAVSQLLQQAHGNVPPGFKLVGWLRANLTEVKQTGWSDEYIQMCLHQAYIDLLHRLRRGS